MDMRKPAIMLLPLLAACSPGGPSAPEPPSHLFTEPDPEGGYVTVAETGDEYAEETVYFSFADGGERYPEDPQQSGGWDLSFRFAWIHINGGSSGSGGMELLPVDFEYYGPVETAPPGEYITDEAPARAFDAGQGWFRYVQGTGEWFINDRYYAIRAASGRYYKLQVIGFLDEHQRPGRLRFRWREIAPPP